MSFTNRALGVGGDANTVSVTVRLPADVVDYMDSHRNGQIKNRSEYLQHWANVGWRVSRDPELAEALEWALDREVQEPKVVELDPPLVIKEPGEVVGNYPLPRFPDEVDTIHDAQLEAMRNRLG